MNVVIADDHPLVRDALARVVLQLDGGSVIRSVGDFSALRDALLDTLPDLLILDLNMPGMDGLSAVRQMRERHPTLAIVIASGQDDPATIRAALGAGANGFIPKSDPPELLIEALRLVCAGGVYIPSRTLGHFVDDRSAAADLDLTGLTPRQQDVLRLLLKGEPNKSIARQLGLTEGTVKVHIAAILRALQVRNRTEAVVRARELGFGRPP
jgi:DNA-binding NarL/FixJ family response regulator